MDSVVISCSKSLVSETAYANVKHSYSQCVRALFHSVGSQRRSNKAKTSIFRYDDMKQPDAATFIITIQFKITSRLEKRFRYRTIVRIKRLARGLESRRRGIQGETSTILRHYNKITITLLYIFYNISSISTIVIIAYLGHGNLLSCHAW